MASRRCHKAPPSRQDDGLLDGNRAEMVESCLHSHPSDRGWGSQIGVDKVRVNDRSWDFIMTVDGSILAKSEECNPPRT